MWKQLFWWAFILLKASFSETLNLFLLLLFFWHQDGGRAENQNKATLLFSQPHHAEQIQIKSNEVSESISSALTPESQLYQNTFQSSSSIHGLLMYHGRLSRWGQRGCVEVLLDREERWMLPFYSSKGGSLLQLIMSSLWTLIKLALKRGRFSA